MFRLKIRRIRITNNHVEQHNFYDTVFLYFFRLLPFSRSKKLNILVYCKRKMIISAQTSNPNFCQRLKRKVPAVNMVVKSDRDNFIGCHKFIHLFLSEIVRHIDCDVLRKPKSNLVADASFFFENSMNFYDFIEAYYVEVWEYICENILWFS